MSLSKISSTVIGDSLGANIVSSFPWSDSSMSMISNSAEFFNNIEKIHAQNRKFQKTKTLVSEWSRSTTSMTNGANYVYIYDHLFVELNANATHRIYDGKRDTFISLSSTQPNVTYQQAMLMKDGRIFMCPVGGGTPVILSFNSTRGFTATSCLALPSIGSNTCSTLLSDGRIFILGDGTGSFIRIYNPTTNTYVTSTVTSTSAGSAGWRKCILLPNGNVLAWKGFSSTVAPLNAIGIYNPSSDTWTTQTCSLLVSGFTVEFQDAHVHDSNTVYLLTGGNTETPNVGQGIFSFNLTTNTFSLVKNLSSLGTFNLPSSITRRPDGVYYIVVTADVYKYDPVSGDFVRIDSGSTSGYYFPRVYMTPDGTLYLLNATISSGGKTVRCDMEVPYPQSFLNSPLMNMLSYNY